MVGADPIDLVAADEDGRLEPGRDKGAQHPIKDTAVTDTHVAFGLLLGVGPESLAPTGADDNWLHGPPADFARNADDYCRTVTPCWILIDHPRHCPMVDTIRR